ncbi:MAG: hypothetical protein O3C43_16525 [Verrucomicrobia bacterium]|nr:hypothetical protein [Verrucomicrobiota bacterium]MDA1068096.1 hypothetical protein [Verrucomicrobiota bacterium]
MKQFNFNDRVWLQQIGCIRSPYDMKLGDWFVTLFRIQIVFFLALAKKLIKLLGNLFRG